jgi:uncharacterized protein YjbI with pentapeptide repeats
VWADLGGADLNHADLRNANLMHANLSRANLTHAHLADTHVNDFGTESLRYLGTGWTDLRFANLWRVKNLPNLPAEQLAVT